MIFLNLKLNTSLKKIPVSHVQSSGSERKTSLGSRGFLGPEFAAIGHVNNSHHRLQVELRKQDGARGTGTPKSHTVPAEAE